MQPLSTVEIGAARSDGRSSRRSVRFLQDLAHALASAIESLQSFPTAVENGVDFYEEVRRFEIGMIERALEAAGGQQKRAAYLLGLKTTTLNAKIKAYGIQAGTRRPRAKRVALMRSGT